MKQTMLSVEQIQEKARIFEKSKEVTLLAERKVDEIKNDQKSHVQFEASIKDSCLRDMLAQLETVRNAPGKDATPKATAETQATEPAMSQKKEKKTPDATQKPHPELQNFKAALAQNAKKDNPAVTTTSGRLSFAARVAAQKAAQTGSSIAK